MAMNPNPDRNQEYMRKMWGTTSLITDYWSGNTSNEELREVVGDDKRGKKHNFGKQNEIHSQIRNDDDYDDWEYGTEPLFG
jgi:hypothetical protein